MQERCDILIVGGGLAGLAFADAWLQRQPTQRIVLLDAGAPNIEVPGASGAPHAMLHPLPGLSLAPKPGYLEAFRFDQRWLQRWADILGPDWLWKTTLARPLWPDDPVNQRLLRSFEKHHHLYGDALQATLLSDCVTDGFVWHPHGAILLDPAYAVAMPKFLTGLTAHLCQHLCMETGQRVLQIVRSQGHWSVTSRDPSHQDAPTRTWQARILVLAVGSGLGQWFPRLPLVLTGGELVCLSPPPLPVASMLRYRGHIIPWPEQHWTLGSTYWDVAPDSGEDWFTWSTSKREIEPAWPGLRQHMTEYFPWLADARVEQVWQGCRTIVHPDRQPLAGPVPGVPDCYVLGALASKGLLLGPWLADRLAAHILQQGSEIPVWSHTHRLTAECWTTSRIVVKERSGAG